MIGRGIDQILPRPGDPRIHERALTSAAGYVELAEASSGPIPRPVDFAYIWGDALAELERVAPDVRIVNLETAVTDSDDYWRGKDINYRLHPDNVPCLTAAGIDCCVLANNHVLDWGYAGLHQTLAALRTAGIATAGAGRDLQEAAAPAVMEIAGRGRVAVFALGSETSGIPREWRASADGPGLNLLADLSDESVQTIARQVGAVRRPRTLVVASIHWGGNWGYAVPPSHREFAHRLIDEAHVDVVHGHSSHHPRAIEVYRDRPILYGCGDFLNDYEGIGGHEPFRPDLTLMYFPRFDAATGKLVRFSMTPFLIRRFRLNRASPLQAAWIGRQLDREGRAWGTRVRRQEDNTLELQWRA